MKMDNKIQTLLFSLGICSRDSIEQFYPHARDREDVSVMRCRKSGIIFLSRTDHIKSYYYQDQKGFDYWSAKDRDSAISSTISDNRRRFRQFYDLVRNRKWLDFGTGAGGILELLSPVALEAVAVEPQKEARNMLLGCGYKVYADIGEVPEAEFDTVTLFHVFEHLDEPIETLKKIAHKIKGGGRLIIEVPHANDALISFFKLRDFKSFTFWSEHLILHTRDSLKIFLENAGFKNIHIYGCQRYPFTNHLYWLITGKPKGHLVWKSLRIRVLENIYAKLLSRFNKTDTLIAIAEK